VKPALALTLTLSLVGAPGVAAAQSRAHRESWLVPSLHAVGLLGAERVGAMLLWPHAFSLEDGDRNLRFLREAYTQPPIFNARRRFFEWDGDRWSINLWGHGLMGSELYLRARQCGHGALPSMAFAAASSAVWEYGFEVWNAHPSVNDLLWTPLGGALIGELRFVVWELAARLPRAVRTVVRVVVDPLGELERVAGSPC
jgi:Domain of unknown function (DUF3943)